MFDMGPYYLTALTSMLGPVTRVSGSAKASFPERTLTGAQRYGEKIPVEIPTHVAGVLDFASGVIGTITTSFDVWSHRLPFLEIYGSEGTLSLPRPEYLRRPGHAAQGGHQGVERGAIHPRLCENTRGIGVADMVAAIKSKRQHRANGEMAYHVLDIMHAIHDASAQGRYVRLKSSMKRPEPLPLGFVAGLCGTLMAFIFNKL